MSHKAKVEGAIGADADRFIDKGLKKFGASKKGETKEPGKILPDVVIRFYEGETDPRMVQLPPSGKE